MHARASSPASSGWTVIFSAGKCRLQNRLSRRCRAAASNPDLCILASRKHESRSRCLILQVVDAADDAARMASAMVGRRSGRATDRCGRRAHPAHPPLGMLIGHGRQLFYCRAAVFEEQVAPADAEATHRRALRSPIGSAIARSARLTRRSGGCAAASRSSAQAPARQARPSP